MNYKLFWVIPALLFSLNLGWAQPLFKVDGNGIFWKASGTTLDILSIDDNTNSILRFGDNNSHKVSLGFNGNEDLFKISTATTLGVEDLTIDESGNFGINTLAGAHRFLISHNSTSNVAGSAQLSLLENNLNDFARLRFQNLGADDFWEIKAQTLTGNYLMEFFYTDGLNEANLLSIDGDENFVGIHQSNPEGYLHIKQQFAGVDALAFVNDNATGGDKWSMRIGDEDILIYFNDDLRGGFDVSTGNYNNFPPAPALAGQTKMKDEVLAQVMQLAPVRIGAEKSTGFNPYEVVKVNPDWVLRSEDGEKLGIDYQQFMVLALKAVQEQQEVIRQQQQKIDRLKAGKVAVQDRLTKIEAHLAANGWK